MNSIPADFHCESHDQLKRIFRIPENFIVTEAFDSFLKQELKCQIGIENSEFSTPKRDKVLITTLVRECTFT